MVHEVDAVGAADAGDRGGDVVIAKCFSLTFFELLGAVFELAVDIRSRDSTIF